MTNINNIPETKLITIHQCHSLKEIQYLPPNLNELKIYQCDTLKYINNIPDSVTFIDLAHCPLLETPSKLPKQLKKIRFDKATPLNISQLKKITKAKIITQ